MWSISYNLCIKSHNHKTICKRICNVTLLNKFKVNSRKKYISFLSFDVGSCFFFPFYRWGIKDIYIFGCYIKSLELERDVFGINVSKWCFENVVFEILCFVYRFACFICIRRNHIPLNIVVCWFLWLKRNMEIPVDITIRVVLGKLC